MAEIDFRRSGREDIGWCRNILNIFAAEEDMRSALSMRSCGYKRDEVR